MRLDIQGEQTLAFKGRMVFISLLLCCFSVSLLARASQTIHVAILANTDKEASAYSRLIDRFHLAYPDYEVTAHFASDARYKAQLMNWLESGEIDVLYWQAGKRLFNLVELGLLAPLDDVWSQRRLQTQFHPGLNQLVTRQGNVYGIPFSYYHWGIFYSKSLFESLQLEEPGTVEELMEACQRIAAQDIAAIGLGAKEKWPLLGWFDYLDLRINGYEFHRQLVKGQSTFVSEEVKKVFQLWRQLLIKCPLNQDFDSQDWDVPVVSMSRQKVGMVLVGNFMQQLFSEPRLKDIGFFPFPVISKLRDPAEAAPTEIWMLSSRSVAKTPAKVFLSFVAQLDELHRFNADIGYVSPDNFYADTVNALTQEGVEMLQRSPNIIQYFDRDAPDELVSAASDILLDFISDKDINRAMQRLEKARINWSEK